MRRVCDASLRLGCSGLSGSSQRPTHHREANIGELAVCAIKSPRVQIQYSVHEPARDSEAHASLCTRRQSWHVCYTFGQRGYLSCLLLDLAGPQTHVHRAGRLSSKFSRFRLPSRLLPVTPLPLPVTIEAYAIPPAERPRATPLLPKTLYPPTQISLLDPPMRSIPLGFRPLPEILAPVHEARPP